jgi:hypothetical protein
VAATLLAACAGDPAGIPVGDAPAPVAPTRVGDGVSFVDAYLTAPAARPPRLAAPRGLAVTSTDPQRGVPRFAWSSRTPLPDAVAVRTPGAAARWHLARHAASLGLDDAALATVEIEHVHDTGRGAIVVQLRQRVGGVEVWRDGMRVVMDRRLGLVALTGTLHPAAVAAKDPPRFGLDARAAIARAVGDVRGAAAGVVTPAGVRAGYQRFAGADLARPARARPVLFPLPDRLVPAYLSEVVVTDGAAAPRAVRHVIAADDGRVLYRTRFDHDAAHSYRVWADTTAPFTPLDGPQEDPTPHPTGQPDGYDPGFIPPVEVTVDSLNGPGDPWLPAGATATSGNNVDAYADLGGNDGYDAGDIRPTTTAAGQFLRTYDTALDPAVSSEQISAAVTQLFFVNNWLHDFWYDSGFDEAAGNAQADNFGRGGIGGDPLHAEGQDSSGTDTPTC